MKTIYDYYQDFESKKLRISMLFDVSNNEEYKKIYDALYYVGFCIEGLEDIELEFDDFMSLLKYASKLDVISFKEEEDLIEYANLLKRIPKDVDEKSKAMYRNILEDVYSKNFYEMYNLEEKVNKKLCKNPEELESSSGLYLLRNEFDKYVSESLSYIKEACKEYPKNFSDSVSYLFLCKNYDPNYMIESLPSKELVCKDYEALEGKSMVPYSEKLYEDYVSGDKELSKYPEEFNNYKIYKKGERKVPFSKSEFIKNIEENRKVK